MAILSVLAGGYLVVSLLFQAPQVLAGTLAADQGAAGLLAVQDSSIPTTTTTITTTTTTATITVGVVEPPPYLPGYVVPVSEAAPEVKQLAVDVAYWLTSYEATDVYADHVRGVVGRSDLDALIDASNPLAFEGYWSRGEVIYPQMGGLRNNRASVMVVVRQTVAGGLDAEFSVVRTLDVRLVKDEEGWRFDSLSSAGGEFNNVDNLNLAHAVASDPRIEMPDSARLDILAGEISPVLLTLMSEMADVTPYGVVVLSTGHPYHVFETDRQSHHTAGRAIDIYRIGDRVVVDDRAEDSATRAFVDWLYAHPSVRQVGSPWDIDGSGSSRSFTDAVHQDHIHIAINES